MRPLLFIVSICLLVCCNCEDNSSELIRLQRENDSLKAWKAEQDSVMLSIEMANSNIDSNLMLVNQKKAAIGALVRKGKLSKKDKAFIISQMDTINYLLELNKSKVAFLDSTLTRQKMSTQCFKQMVESMGARNVVQGDKLNGMKKELAQVSQDFSDLFQEFVYREAENMEMREQLSSAEQMLLSAKEKLNSAWYVVGTKDALKQKGIVYKSGLFDSKSVNEDFDKNQFRKIDIHELKEIMLDSRKAEVITTHPTGSYELIGIKKKVNKLVIVDPEQFWSVSKFLIIEIE